MKKLIYALCAVLAVCMSSCKYDDSDLWNSVNDLDKRITTLEEMCNRMNTNISSLQTLVYALQENDYITSVSPLIKDGETVGYKINFTKSPSITIYHGKDGQNGSDGKDGADGKDGKDGYTPQISLKQDVDGHYYWTLDGEWLLDSDGNKVLADGIPGRDGQNGTDGKDGQDGADGLDGITPQFKIENGDWYVSIDYGLTWKYLGRATGNDGNDGQNGNDGDSLFKNIDTSNPDFVIFTLADGTEFKVARHDALSISFDSENLIAMGPNSTCTIKYTISGAKGNLQVEVLSSGNVRAKISDNKSATGIMTVTTGATIDEYDKVIMLATDGKSTVMSSISFEEDTEKLLVTSGTTYYMDAVGGSLSITIETNTNFNLSIPEEAKNWINVVSSRALRQETLNLNVSVNEGMSRSATLGLLGKEGKSFGNIQITQSGKVFSKIPSDMEEAFPDEWFRKFVMQNFDSDKDGVISQSEADMVNTISFNSYSFNDKDKIRSIEGIQYFQNLTSLKCIEMGLTNLDVSKNTALVELSCGSNQLTTLNLSNNIALTQLDCSNNKLTNLDVSKNIALTKLSCSSNQLICLDVSNNKVLTELSCYWNQLTSLCLSNNIALTKLNCTRNQLTNLDVSKNTELIRLYCARNQLESLDLSKNIGLTYLYCIGNQLTRLDVSKNTALISLMCAYNSLNSLDVSKNVALTLLNCSSNQLTVLDVSKNTALLRLDCDRNQLTVLDVSKNVSITYLDCSNNQLVTLELSNNTALNSLECSSNQLITLDLSKNIAINFLDCSSNKLTTLDVSKTNIGNNTDLKTLNCSNMPDLTILYLRNGWEIDGITKNRNINYIPNATEIIFVE